MISYDKYVKDRDIFIGLPKEAYVLDNIFYAIYFSGGIKVQCSDLVGKLITLKEIKNQSAWLVLRKNIVSPDGTIIRGSSRPLQINGRLYK